MWGPHLLLADTQSAHIWAQPAIGHGKHTGHIRTLATTTTCTAFRWHADCTILLRWDSEDSPKEIERCCVLIGDHQCCVSNFSTFGTP
jgi:hypothetical protein